uniref:FERM central domain-containing protein n=1 Tax=Phlebotomus papatasi TaxID=29031 RepID=A0A1B0DAK5_PHLPP
MVLGASPSGRRSLPDGVLWASFFLLMVVIPTCVYLMSRIAVHMEIEGTAQCPSQVMLAAALGCEELGIANKLLAQSIFGLWMTSSLLDPRILELLYEEARHNVLMGRYIMEPAHSIMLGGIQARVELGPYNSHTHTIGYFRQSEFSNN